MRPTISRFRAVAWSKSEPRSPFEPGRAPIDLAGRLIFVSLEARLAADKQAFEWRKWVTEQGHQVHDLAAEEVSRGMAEGRYLLVDVREPNEVAADAYPGAVVVPLSSFDPQAIPDPKRK